MKFVKQKIDLRYHSSIYADTVDWCIANISPLVEHMEGDDALFNKPVKLPILRKEYKEFVKDDVYRSIFYGQKTVGDGWRVLGIHYSEVVDNANYDLLVEITDDTAAVHYRLVSA